MARTPIPGADSSAAAVVGPLRDSFLHHLAAENRSPPTRITYAAAIDLLAAFAAADGMPTLTGMRREHGRTAGRGTSYLQWRASREALPFYASLGLIGDPVPIRITVLRDRVRASHWGNALTLT